MTMEKRVHWCGFVRGVTAGGILLLSGCGVWCACEIASPGISGSDRAVLAGIMAVTVVSLVMGWVHAPLAVTLSDDGLAVRRGVGSKRFDYSSIVGVRRCGEAGRFVRVCGSGGFFGYTGYFYHRRIGRFFAYVGDFSQAVCLELKNGKRYVFSCEDPDEVVSRLEGSLK